MKPIKGPPSPSNNPGFGCLGKQAFMTFAIASKSVASRRSRNRGQAGVLQIYRCPHCNAWHLGGSLKPRRAGQGR